jgi:DNA mismatch repair ATPase MutS
MRIADSLGENTSTFYAELKRLRAVLEAVKEKKPIIALLDEVLRGTNSSDRHKGAKAIINQIIKHNSVGVVASHDLELANPEQIAAKTIDAYYFDVKINADELYFDYTLTPGVNPSLNAAVLMKKMGIELEE